MRPRGCASLVLIGALVAGTATAQAPPPPPTGTIAGHVTDAPTGRPVMGVRVTVVGDRKSTRLNSSHRCTSYAVFCLKKKSASAGAAPPPCVVIAGTGCT